MATGMKQLLASLLLCCIITVNGERGAEKKDPCTQGMAAVQLFMEYRGCSGPDPWEVVRNMTRELRQEDLSVSVVENVFSTYCSSLPQRMVECFEGNIQNCTAEQRDSLMAVARQTGFACQPDSSQVHPQVLYVLSRLRDSDLVHDRAECRGMPIHSIRDQCHTEAIAAIGLHSPDDYERLESLSIEQLVPKIQTYSSTIIECMITGMRDAPNRCSQWRGMALSMVIDFILMNMLGRNMTFTQPQLDQMFEWQTSTVNGVQVDLAI